MFGLIKTLITFVIVFLLVGVGIAYLPPETQSKVTSQVASVAVKGCRGGQMLYQAFKQKMIEEAKSSIGSEELPSDGDSIAAADKTE